MVHLDDVGMMTTGERGSEFLNYHKCNIHSYRCIYAAERANNLHLGIPQKHSIVKTNHKNQSLKFTILYKCHLYITISRQFIYQNA